MWNLLGQAALTAKQFIICSAVTRLTLAQWSKVRSRGRLGHEDRPTGRSDMVGLLDNVKKHTITVPTVSLLPVRDTGRQSWS